MTRKLIKDMSEEEQLIQRYKDRPTLKLILEKMQYQKHLESGEIDIAELKGFEKARKDGLKCDIVLTVDCWEKMKRDSLESSIEMISLIDEILMSRGST